MTPTSPHEICFDFIVQFAVCNELEHLYIITQAVDIYVNISRIIGKIISIDPTYGQCRFVRHLQPQGLGRKLQQTS